MFGSTIVYSSLLMLLAGVGLAFKPMPRLRVRTRRQAVSIAAGAAAIAAYALLAPSFESRAATATSRLDEFAPVWQFREFHARRIPAPADRVFAAISRVRADDILFFQTLTWIRRGGRPLPPGILNPGADEPLLDVALRGGFVLLASDPPRERVIGAIVARPPGPRVPLTSDMFLKPFPPGVTVAAMNFRVTPDGPNASIVSTETRVYANDPSSRRTFAAYWRLIYPGSAVIRRMWLRAIDRRVSA